MDKEFETFWKENQRLLVLNAPERMREEMLRASKLDTPIDWICFALPVITGILVQPLIPVKSEILSWGLMLLVVIVLFVVLQIVRPYFSKKKTETQVMAEIKRYYYEKYVKAGSVDALATWKV